MPHDSRPEVQETHAQRDTPALGTATGVALAFDRSPSSSQAQWSFALRIGFRFACAYLLFYSFPYPLTAIPGVAFLFKWYTPVWNTIVIWTGAHVLHLSQPIQVAFNGSGDRTYDYVKQLLILVFALTAMLLWSFIDRQRKNYTYLHQWLRLCVRLFLGGALLSYGASKVIKAQFPDPSLWRLLEPYGDSSPMGLLWTFMGYSTAYTAFAGAVEMVAGALLIIPRLATLGALLSIGAMGNIFMLNMSYDVPVKLFSFNLLAMGVFLLAPEMRRLLDVFVLNREARPLTPPLLFQRRWLKMGLLVVQLVFLLYVAGDDLYRTKQRVKPYTINPPLYGIYSVDELTIDGQVHPPLFSDASRWRRFTFDRFETIGIQPADGSMQRYNAKLDLGHKSLQLTKRGDQNWKSNFIVETPSAGVVVLKGEMDGKKIQAMLRKVDVNAFPLNSRGFHWINEFPYNR